MIIVLIAVVAIVFLYITLYNSLVRKNQNAQEAWSDIETQLKRRLDLIPNLINTVKGYAKHEQDTLEKVIVMRSKAMNASTVTDTTETNNAITGALKTIFALSENYPDLKANTNFIELQRELSDTETKIQLSRRFYNTAVSSLNIAIESFPANWVARRHGFIKRSFFELQESEKIQAYQPVQINF